MIKKIGPIVISILLWEATSQAQEMAVPIDAQFPLFLKMFIFDRNFKTRVGDEVVIGIVYQKKFRASLNVKNKIINEISGIFTESVEGTSVRYVPIDMGDRPDLERAVSKHNVDILYATPLRALEIGEITAVSRARKILTLTGVPDYVESGLTVGIGVKGKRPQIIINLSAAKAEEVDFNSRLLKLAKIVK